MGETLRLTDFIRWMYWIHIYLIVGMVVLATIVYSSMSSRFLFFAPLLAEGPGLSSQGSV